MKGFVTWATSSAIAMGGVGLFLVAFIDASVLSLPEASDVLIVVTASKSPSHLVYYASMLAAGATVGSLILFALGRMGGRALLDKKFSGRRVERGYRLVQRYGFLTVFVASLLPPPTPFKLFVLLAGAGGMSAVSFTASVALGRGVRYLGEGLLALRYGDKAMDTIRANGVIFALVLTATALTGGLVYFVWRRLRPRPVLDSVLERR
jgi:membrane protein YqaA with SNARE-associated domain